MWIFIKPLIFYFAVRKFVCVHREAKQIFMGVNTKCTVNLVKTRVNVPITLLHIYWRETGKLRNLGFRQFKTIIIPLIPVSCSSVSCCRRCVRCAKRCSFCSAVSCWRLLLPCSRWISSRRSRSRGVSVENLPGRGFGATCCACMSSAWEIVRDSPMVNFVSQTMNKHIRMRLGHRRRSVCCLETQNAPWRHWRTPSIYL